jgi:hypothetical protein
MRFDLANLPTDTATLHRIIAAQAAESKVREAELAAAKAGLMAKALELEKLRLQIAWLRRQQFGRSSEKVARTIEQLELKLEELEAETPAPTEADDTSAAVDSSPSSVDEPASPPDDKKKKLIHVGQAGTGFDQATLKEVFGILKPIETSKNPFTGPVEAHNVHWAKPLRVAEVKFSEWTHTTNEGGLKLRAPVFMGLREDKDPEDCTFAGQS